jgi:hypothetical protein
VKGPKIKKSIPFHKIAWCLAIIAIASIAGWTGIKLLTLSSTEIKNQINEDIDEQMRAIELKVVIDSIKQYKIAKEHGSAMDAYVQAGLVSAALLQAKESEKYKEWKVIERKEGIRAGMPPELLK